ncbi:MAG: PAS domain S-box protein [Dehalococcoidia bacterium]
MPDRQTSKTGSPGINARAGSSGQAVSSIGLNYREMEESLAELEFRHLTVLDSISEGVVITQKGVNRYSNRALSDITGWTADEVISMPPLLSMITLASGGKRSLDAGQLQRGKKAGNHKEYRIKCKDGTTKDVEMATLRIKYNGREAYMTLVKDITQYRRIEVALLESEERFRVILDSASNAIVYYDLSGNILLMNIAGARLMGGEPDDFIGKRVHDIFPKEGKAILKRVIRVAENGEGGEYKDNVVIPPGERWFLSRFDPVRNGSGEIFAVQTISYDITDYEHLAQAWRDLSRRLVEVQEEERHHIASELHDQVGQSLTGLKLMFGRILSEYNGGNQSVLKEAQNILDDLVERVRELSLNLRPSMLDDLGLVPSLLWLIERYETQTGVKVDFKHKGVDQSLPEDMTIVAYRIVQESLTNVARHAGVNKVAVWLMADDENLIVHVYDAGAGFDPEVERSSRPSSGLTGMKERAKALGGWVTISSTPGHGTDVVAHLPFTS